uniref:Universal stress protein n=1 Tax=Thermomicrobium roseum TaxID=500 RepID=A0A7C2B3R0_THERO
MIETVLAAHDGSTAADAVLPASALLARLFLAPVVVVRVLETMRPFYDPTRGEVVWLSPEESRLDVAAEEFLAEQLAVLEQLGVQARAVVRLGRAEEELVAEATRWPAPVLVVASHGRGGLGRAVLGSIADRVLRTAPCPVLVVRVGGAPLERLEHVLVPLDGSEQAERALPYACALAERAHARITLVRVAETYREVLLEWRGRPIAAAAQEMLRQLEQEALAYLEDVRARVPGHLEVRIQMLSGEPKRELVAAVERERPDLVVLTTRGRGGVTRWLLGSVTERLATATRVPLFVVPSETTDERPL